MPRGVYPTGTLKACALDSLCCTGAGGGYFFRGFGTIVEDPGQQSQSKDENRGVLHFASNEQTRRLRTNEVMECLG